VLIQTVSQDTTYPFNSYILSSINGENVIVDPTLMPKKEIVDIYPVAICGTHNHPDHQHPAYTNSYDCPKLLNVKGEIQTEDFNIYSIPASHARDTIAETPTNVLIVFEVDGLRIVHMGDIGQTVLTKEQLTELGEIDIAFMQFENSYSQMDLKNEKGFNLIEQLNPKIIIPTHFTKDGLVELETRYGTITEFDNALEISKEDLPEDTLNVYRILNTHKYR
jgi:L-ascorbate metabolism protein UlaG (beta-lactamase superfamily)